MNESHGELADSDLEGRRVLVTGATGFIGRRLVRRLIAAGARVRLLARPTSNLRVLAEMAAQVEVCSGDLGESSSLQGAVRGAELVFHLATAAGPAWEEVHQATVLGTESLLQSARRFRVSRFVYVSSMSVYDFGRMRPGGVVDESAPIEADPCTRNHYARSKCEADAVVRRSLGDPEMAVTIVRPGAVYGPGGPAHIPTTIRIVAGRVAFAIGGGRRAIPLVFVDDLVNALLRIAVSPAAAGKIYNVVDDAPVPERRYVSQFLALRGRRAVMIPLPQLPFLWAAVLYDWASRLRRRNPNSTLLRSLRRVTNPVSFSAAAVKNDLGWRARTELDDGMRASLEDKADAPH